MGWWRQRRAAKKRRLAQMSRKKRVARRVGLLFTWVLALLAALTTVLAITVYSVVNVPSPDSLDTNQTAQVLYSNGSLMANITGGENRTIVALAKVPESVRWSVIAAEDRGFYSEPGVSFRGTARAVLSDLSGHSTQGGSTITQQYVKNAYLNSDQTMSRKLKELAIALKLSREFSKDQILEYYLNTIYFGRDTYGIEAAAEAYFNVDVSKLTVAQGALLAAVIKSPEYYDPRVTPAAAKARWNYVVDGLVSIGKLSRSDRDKLKFPATSKQKSVASALDGPLGLVWTQVKGELAADGIDPATINTKGLRIQTTIDQNAQADAEQAVKDNFSNLTSLQKKQKMRPALTAVNPADGAVLAYYGNSKGSALRLRERVSATWLVLQALHLGGRAGGKPGWNEAGVRHQLDLQRQPARHHRRRTDPQRSLRRAVRLGSHPDRRGDEGVSEHRLRRSGQRGGADQGAGRGVGGRHPQDEQRR